eukprot:g3776.t1
MAIAMNLTAPTAEDPDISKTVIRSDVVLTSEQYQIIMHVRLFRLGSDGETRKYDVAMGISRNVINPEEDIGRSSATSIISAAAVVFVILFGCGFIEYKVYSGTFTWDSLLTSLSGEYFVNFVRIVIKIAGMSVWTVFFGSTILTEGDLVNVVPLAYCAVIIGWLFSLFCVYAYSRNVYNAFADEKSDVLSERQKKKNELGRNLHDKLLDFYGIFFESIPLASCLVWAALSIGDADIITLIALSLSMGDLGFKLMSVKGYKDVKSEIEMIDEAATLSRLLEKAVGPEKAHAMTTRARVDCDRVNPPPRKSVGDSQETAQVFGVDVNNLRAGESVTITGDTLGYPILSLSDLDNDSYCVQADLVPYRVYHRGDGFSLTLPTTCVSDGGQNGDYDSPTGTLYSDVAEISWPPVDGELTLKLTYRVPQPVSPGCSGYGEDTDYIKTVSVKSNLLSDFWGTDMLLEACVLLPAGFHEHPNTTYPLVVAHGHYSAIFNPGGRFDMHEPNANLSGYARYDQEAANWLARNWTDLGPKSTFHGARSLVVTIKHPVPYFDDSYSVDSENVGPYGSAIMTELLPEVEKLYRGIGQGWARGVMGGSTGGWESLAAQVLYPDEFNYAAVACPDPVSFTSYVTMNIYSDHSAYVYDSSFKKTPRPGTRDAYSGTSVLPNTSIPTYGHPYGQTTATMEEMARREIVLGPKSRSCSQLDIWEAVFGPRGKDGYPARIWCKDPKAGCEYGAIDRTVANYWKENFDLMHIMKRDWTAKGLGEKLRGKLHLFVGNSDTFFLTNAVMDLQDFLESPSLSPPYEGSVTIGTHEGRGFEHCFNGYLPNGKPAPNGVSREMYVSKFIPRMAERWRKTAPNGADLSWVY